MAKPPSRSRKKTAARTARVVAGKRKAGVNNAPELAENPAERTTAAARQPPPATPGPSSAAEPAAPGKASPAQGRAAPKDEQAVAADTPGPAPVQVTEAKAAREPERPMPQGRTTAATSAGQAQAPAGKPPVAPESAETTGKPTPQIKPAAEAETPADRSGRPATPEALTATAEPVPVPAAPSETTAPAETAAEQAEPEAVPAAEPGPVAMPAQAESVHVEEPVPDEAPESAAAEPARAPLYIVHVSPEMAPVAKVGGLADVVFGLSGELGDRGNHVEIILPKYDNLRYDQIWGLHEAYHDLWVPWYDGTIHCTVFNGQVHGRNCFFIESHSADNFFNRGSIYGFADDILRFAFFSRAAMEFMFKSGKHPDVIHCHDWQSALVPVLLYELYQHLGMTHPRVCLTIHNFRHQGVTGMEMLRATGLHNPDRFFDYNRLRDNSNHHALNLLKGGIVYSNFVTTVSPRYAMETRDLDQGFGLQPTLHTHQVKYGGVVNGIEYDVWNPEVDRHIPVQYGVDHIEGKYENKRALRHRLMLADSHKPIVAFIGRLDPQKGLDLVRHGIFYALERGAQFVLLGSSPDHRINADFWGLKGMLNDSPDCHLEIGFDEELSHLIYAGADMMLVPSRFEPCGLTQLIALRYGTIPVVRAVGGLADTVFDKDHSPRPLHERNGYVFENYDNRGLESALGRAIACYFDYPGDFREVMRNAMRSDYSWRVPGQDYLNIYDYIRHK